MVESDHGDETDRRSIDVERRWLMNLLGTGAVAGLAGCGGDDGDGDGGGTTTTATTMTAGGDGEDTTTTTTTTEDDGEDDGEDTTTTEQGMQRYDNQPVISLYRRPAAPPDSQYQSYSPQGDHSWDGAMRFGLLSRSFADGQIYGEMCNDWEYTPGLLEISLHDDWHYWTGENIDADNILLHWRLQDFVGGGDDLNAHSNVIRAEKTGDLSVRFALTDTWRETYAIVQTMEYWGPSGTTEYYRPWLQKFRDAANQSDIEDLRTKLEETTEKDPNPFNHNPFKIVDATENRWIFKLRTPENNELPGDQVPHFVDEINYLNFEYIVGTEEQRENQLFLEGRNLASGPDDFSEDELPFPITSVEFSRATDQWSFLFNCSTPPTNDRHFRRAIAYMTNRKQYMQPREIPDEVLTPFMTPDREQRYVSSDVLEGLTDYGWDETRREEATREMEAGGFERDSRGRWLFKQGDRAGEPMEFTISRYVWQDQVGNQGTDFIDVMSDWGIGISVEKGDGHW
jgi:hypothetical protein